MKIPDQIYATIKAALLSELNECRASAKRVQKAKLMPGSFKEALKNAWEDDEKQAREALEWVEVIHADSTGSALKGASEAQQSLSDVMAATGLGGNF